MMWEEKLVAEIEGMVKRYDQTIEPKQHCDIRLNDAWIREGVLLEHMLFMCVEIRKMALDIDHGVGDWLHKLNSIQAQCKLHRWIGSLQTMCGFFFNMTVDEMRVQTKAAMAP